MKIKVIEGKELQAQIDNQEICLSCGLDRNILRNKVKKLITEHYN